jgi:hypothetical protein
MTSDAWAGGDFQQPPRTDGGVALCGACRRTGACRLGLTTEHLDAEGVAHFDLGEITLSSSGATLASAEGVFVLRTAEAHFGAFERWLAEQ